MPIDYKLPVFGGALDGKMVPYTDSKYFHDIHEPICLPYNEAIGKLKVEVYNISEVCCKGRGCYKFYLAANLSDDERAEYINRASIRFFGQPMKEP